MELFAQESLYKTSLLENYSKYSQYQNTFD